MRLAFLAQRNSIHTVRWVNALAQRGYEVHLISMHDNVHEIHPEVVCHTLPHPLPTGYFLNVSALKRLLAKLKPDLLHTHFASGYGTLGRLSNFHPNILSVWGSDVYDFPAKSPLHRWLIAQNLRAADWICSTSRVMANQTKTLHTPEHLSVTPFGIDTKLFSSAAKQAALITIGTVKTLEPKYGVDLLLRTFASLRKGLDTNLRPGLRLKIVGGGSQEEELLELARSLNIAEQTQFVGRVAHKDVPGLLNSFDIYVALSRLESESFGVAILEASACGLPVVVANVGGLPEVVREGETGFIVEKENVAEAAQALKKLVLDSVLRKRMGMAGRKHVVENYDWEQSVDLMEKVYQRVIEKIK